MTPTTHPAQTTAGDPITIRVQGTGATVLLVHGLGFSGEAWSPLASALAAHGARVATYDQRGFGEAPLPRASYEMSDLAADLEAVRRALQVEHLHLVGHSMGGMVVQQYAVDYPAQVRSLVVASATSHNGRRATAFARAMSLLSRDGFEVVRSDPARWPEVEAVLGEALPVTEPLLAFLARLTHKAAPARALAWGANAGFSVKDALPELSCPTLVLHGGADMLIPPTAGRQIARAIPGASWEVFAGGGHNFPLKQAEGFEAAVVAHLVAAGALPVTD